MYYLIVGATCAGKDRIAGYITKELEDFKTIISTTSRPIRPNEKDGLEYHFVSDQEFKDILNDDGFVEYRIYNTVVGGVQDTWYYGLEKRNVSDTHSDYVVVIDYKGATEFMEYFGRETCVLVYIKSLYSERYIRNVLRGDFSLHEWLRRNKDDAGWLNEAEIAADVVIENYGFDYPTNPVDPELEIDIKEGFKSSFQNTKDAVKFKIQVTRNQRAIE